MLLLKTPLRISKDIELDIEDLRGFSSLTVMTSGIVEVCALPSQCFVCSSYSLVDSLFVFFFVGLG
jgi:hypothetical protein